MRKLNLKIISGRAYLYDGSKCVKKLGTEKEAMKNPEYINYLKRKHKNGETI